MRDIFYFTDVHGNFPLFKAAIGYCTTQDPDSMIIYGGDACDRGSDGYQIMKELLEHPQVVYLKGNHEDMFVHAARFVLKDFKRKPEATVETFKSYLYGLMVRDYAGFEVSDHLYNGGMPTLLAWFEDGMPESIIDQIATLPLTFSTDIIDFCHAGGDYRAFKRAADCEYNDEFVDKEDAENLLWDRNYIGMAWENGRICVHGHTPVYHLPSKYYQTDKSKEAAHPTRYVGLLDDRLTGAKIDMDVGTYSSGKLYVLNCLTMKTQGFRDTDFGNDEIKNHDVEEIEIIQF